MKLLPAFGLSLLFVCQIARSAEIDNDCKTSSLGECGFCARIATNRTLVENSHRCSLCTNGYVLDAAKIWKRAVGDTTTIGFNQSCTAPPSAPARQPSSNGVALTVFFCLIAIAVATAGWMLFHFCIQKGNISKEFSKKASKSQFGDFIVPDAIMNPNNSVNASLVHEKSPVGKPNQSNQPDISPMLQPTDQVASDKGKIAVSTIKKKKLSAVGKVKPLEQSGDLKLKMN